MDCYFRLKKVSEVRKLRTKAFLQKSFDCTLWLLPCWNPLETNLSEVKLKRKDVSCSFVQCLLQSCFRSELKEFWSVNELSYLFYPINIRAFCMAVSLSGSWVSLSPGLHTFVWSSGIHCFSVAHHPKKNGVGNLRVSDFFQFVGCHQLIKCRISRKD